MQIYRYRVSVIKGVDNATADFLSRCGNDNAWELQAGEVCIY